MLSHRPLPPPVLPRQAYHHGDNWNAGYVNSMPAEDRIELEYLQSLPVKYK